MTVLIAPDSFKGTYSASAVAEAIAKGVRPIGHHLVELAVADGGEGTFEALVTAFGAKRIPVRVLNPWGWRIDASIGMVGEVGLVELAQASGLTVHHHGIRHPFDADTYGTGMLIAEAVRLGARRILVAAGGSATTDGGAGAVRAIHDAGGLQGATLEVLSDVSTCFEDAARVFGRQKGADTSTISLMEERLRHLAATYPRDPRGVPRTGAAGGFSGGLWANFGAELVSGADRVLDAISFDTHLKTATAVVVGEGRLDSQTGQGKIISAILRRVHLSPRPIPVFAVVGSVAPDLGAYRNHFTDIIVATNPRDLERAGAAIAVALERRR